MPPLCTRITAQVKGFVLLSLGSSAATPEIECCPLLLTTWELKILQTPGQEKEVTLRDLATDKRPKFTWAPRQPGVRHHQPCKWQGRQLAEQLTEQADAFGLSREVNLKCGRAGLPRALTGRQEDEGRGLAFCLLPSDLRSSGGGLGGSCPAWAAAETLQQDGLSSNPSSCACCYLLPGGHWAMTSLLCASVTSSVKCGRESHLPFRVKWANMHKVLSTWHVVSIV